jgi:hypothetical protein
MVFKPMVTLIKVRHLLGLGISLLGWNFLPNPLFFISCLLAGCPSFASSFGFISRIIVLGRFCTICHLKVVILEGGHLRGESHNMFLFRGQIIPLSRALGEMKFDQRHSEQLLNRKIFSIIIIIFLVSNVSNRFVLRNAKVGL